MNSTYVSLHLDKQLASMSMHNKELSDQYRPGRAVVG